MAGDLEPPPGDDPAWDELYVAREDEVPAHRPIYAGDVFTGVPLRPTRGEPKNRTIMVIQHPCAMRPDGVNLGPSILVARVRPFGVLDRDRWTTNGKLMPLPDLRPSVNSNQRNQAAFFDDTYHVHPDDLALGTRSACLSEIGTYLMLQRWVYHSSRVVPPTWQVEEMNSHLYAEADLLEAWCEQALAGGVTPEEALVQAAAWLDEPSGGTTRRAMLRTSALRSSLNRGARQATEELYGRTAQVIPLKAPRAAKP